MKIPRLLMGGATALALTFPAAAAPPQKADPSAADVLPICEKALDAAFEGRDAKAVVEDAVKGLPDDQRNAVLAICGVYLAGAIDAVKRVRAAPTLPAGGTRI